MAVFTGAGVALVTPFHADGSINYDKLEELILKPFLFLIYVRKWQEGVVHLFEGAVPRDWRGSYPDSATTGVFGESV